MSKFRNDDMQRFAEMFKALSNPNRLSIFLRLASCCGLQSTCDANTEWCCECVGELGKNLGIVPSTVSHHIKELNRTGLIRMERRGQKIECWVDPDILNTLMAFFKEPTCI